MTWSAAGSTCRRGASAVMGWRWVRVTRHPGTERPRVVTAEPMLESLALLHLVDLVRDQPMSFAMHGVYGVGVGCLDEAEDLSRRSLALWGRWLAGRPGAVTGRRWQPPESDTVVLDDAAPGRTVGFDGAPAPRAQAVRRTRRRPSPAPGSRSTDHHEEANRRPRSAMVRSTATGMRGLGRTRAAGTADLYISTRL